jgi:hypothetical protein
MVEKCFNCSKKLHAVHFKCKCEEKLCVNCRLPEVHDCKYNYEKLKVNLIKIVGSKVIII